MTVPSGLPGVAHHHHDEGQRGRVLDERRRRQIDPRWARIETGDCRRNGLRAAAADRRHPGRSGPRLVERDRRGAGGVVAGVGQNDRRGDAEKAPEGRVESEAHIDAEDAREEEHHDGEDRDHLAPCSCADEAAEGEAGGREGRRGPVPHERRSRVAEDVREVHDLVRRVAEHSAAQSGPARPQERPARPAPHGEHEEQESGEREDGHRHSAVRDRQPRQIHAPTLRPDRPDSAESHSATHSSAITAKRDQTTSAKCRSRE